MTHKGLGGKTGDSKEMRSFAQIIPDERQNRNILEVKIRKITKFVDDDQVSVKPLTIEEVSVLIFDVIKLQPNDCLGVALRTSRFDYKDVKIKPGVDPTPYLTGNQPNHLQGA